MIIDNNGRLAPVVLNALCREYFTGIAVDVEKDRYEALHFSSWMEKYPPEGKFSDFVETYVEEYVTGESQNELRVALASDTINRRMEGTLENRDEECGYYMDYASMRYGEAHWCKSTVLPLQYKENGKIQLVLVLLQDITEQKKMELQSKEQENAVMAAIAKKHQKLMKETRQSEIISAISTLYKEIAVVYLKDMTYEIVSGPRKFEGVKGKIEMLMEPFVRKMVFRDDWDEFEAFVDFTTLDKRMEGKRYIQKEFRSVDEKWHDLTFIVKKWDRTGKIASVLVAVRDIDEQKKHDLEYQEQLKSAKKAAEQAREEADRANEAKTNFLRRISHDIRTPINGIRGLVQMSNYYGNDPERLDMCRSRVLGSTDHLLSLVNDVLDMSKLESGKFTLRHDPFRLSKVLEEVCIVSASQADEANVGFVVNNTQEMEHDRLIGSPVYLKRILLNFTSNAIKYNRVGGQVSVYGKEVSFDGKTAWYEFVCEDTGIGMSEEFQKHAFEPFTQEEKDDARTRYAGTGLGLAITKQLTDLMGGTIELKSTEQVGTRVVFRLPLEVDFEEHPEKEKTDYSKVMFDGVKALLVEDNDLNAEIALFLLEQHGMKATWVQNGQMAVSAVSEDDYDVIFMDIMMPVMNGLEAAKAIRRINREIPMFAMTANAFTDDIQKSLEAGMNAHLTKPLQEKEIIKAVMKYIKYKKD